MSQKIRLSIAPIGSLIVAIAFLICLAVAAISYHAQAQATVPTTGQRLITIYDRGAEIVVLSEARTIKDVLNEAGIAVDDSDVVEPSLGEELVASDYQVNIYRARPIIVVDGAVKQKIVTAYQTPIQIAASVGITLYEEDITSLSRVDDIIGEGAGLQMTIDRAIPFQLTLYGKTMAVRTQAETVGEMLKEKKIELGKDDRVSVSLNTPITTDLMIRVWREGRQTITVDEEIGFDIEQINDADREIGYKAVRSPGEKGLRSVTYEVIIQDGKEVTRTEIASITTKQPSKQIEIVGTKNNYSGSLNEWLAALRVCETGGNYTTNTNNGFYGAYQFMISTWNSTATKVGRTDLVGVRPDLTSSTDQDFMVVANTSLSRGGLATQHPGCYRKLGLSQFPPG
jgi:uncharacterized protein YabE (DUF348 family)